MMKNVYILASSLAASLLLASCTIIVNPSKPEPVPVPSPTPLGCFSALGVPTAHMFFDVRIERTTVNLMPYYSRMMQMTGLALTTAGIMPTEAAMIRLDERPVDPPVLAAWGCNFDDPRELTPEMVIEHYATRSPLPASPIGCATDPMVFAGAHLGELVTQYPLELPGTDGKRMFGSAPSLVLIMHIDHTGRRTGLQEAPCADAEEMRGDRNGAASWLAYSGEPIPASRVIHWFFTTEELVDRDTFIAGCKAYEGFPSDVLDLIDPSEKPLYGPLAQALRESGSHVATLPLCAMMVDDQVAPFLAAQIHAIAAIAGTKVDEDAFANVLAGGLPNGPGQMPAGR